MHTIFLLGNLKERDNSEDLGVSGRDRVVECGLNSSGSGYRPVTVPCEHDNET